MSAMAALALYLLICALLMLIAALLTALGYRAGQRDAFAAALRAFDEAVRRDEALFHTRTAADEYQSALGRKVIQ